MHRHGCPLPALPSVGTEERSLTGRVGQEDNKVFLQQEMEEASEHQAQLEAWQEMVSILAISPPTAVTLLKS